MDSLFKKEAVFGDLASSQPIHTAKNKNINGVAKKIIW